MNHVILEGPDGAGKTTVAQEKFPGHVYHHEGPPPAMGVLEHYAGLLVNARVPTVFDRFHLGEFVYGPILRDGSRLSKGDLSILNMLITLTKTTVIICLPPWQTCLKNNHEKDEYIKDDITRRCAYDRWELMARTFRCEHILLPNTTVYDYTTGYWTHKEPT